MDNLGYTYTGNRLDYVNDSHDANTGFINGNTGTDDYAYDNNGNLIKDRNKGIQNNDDIQYNFLNLPQEVVKGMERIKYHYDASGQKLTQEVYNGTNLVKSTDYIGALVLENGVLQFVNHAEGRAIPNENSWEYQYHLKDHLGNVRLTFTTKEDVQSALATLEPASAATEQSKFLRLESARKVYSALFDRTNGASLGYSERLNGTANEQFGIARTLSVMSGDTLKMEVFAKYVDPNSTNLSQALTSFLGSIATGKTTGGLIDGANYANSTSSFSYAGLLNKSSDPRNGPKAYLNWLFFDRNYNYVNGGYQRMSDAAREQGQDVDHEKLSASVPITQPGYVYIYLSNEEATPVDVFFDDLSIELVQGQIVQMDDYYPFGLSYNFYQRENSVKNKYKFQGQEHVDDLGLAWDAFKWRNHQPDIGRFFNVDPLAEDYYYNSPYAFSENKVITHIELEGLEAVGLSISSWEQEATSDGQMGEGLVESVSDGATGLWNLVTNPVEAITNLASGINNIITDPVGTGISIATETAANYQANPGKFLGKAVGNVLLTAASGGLASEAKVASDISKATKVTSSVAKVEKVVAKTQEVAKTTTKLSKVEKSVTTKKIGDRFTKTTEVRPGKGPGQSRAEISRYKNQSGKVIRTQKDSYDRANKFQHRKPLTGGPEGRIQ